MGERGERSNFAPHGALGGLAQATVALVAGAPSSTSGDGWLGDGGSDGRGWRVEAVSVKKGVPIAVRVRLSGWEGNRGSHSRACGGAGSDHGRARGARNRP